MNGVKTAIELRTSEGGGELRHRSVTGAGGWEVIPLNGPDQVLNLLADPRLSFLWPAIDRWAGADLVRLRDAAVERTRLAWEKRRAKPPSRADIEAMQKNVDALLEYTDALSAAGRLAEASTLLTAARNGLALREMSEIMAWVIISNRLASVRLDIGDVNGSLALLREAAFTAGAPVELNARVTLAAYLAEHERWAEALKIIDDARAVFDAYAPPPGRDKSDPSAVSGAHLQFNWIRACALHGLGRTIEADALIASVKAASQPVASKKNGIVPPKVFDTAVRADSCVRDEKALAATLTRELSAPPLGSNVFLYMQPAYTRKHFDRPTFIRARGQVRAGPNWRILPAQYSIAIAHWRAD